MKVRINEKYVELIDEGDVIFRVPMEGASVMDVTNCLVGLLVREIPNAVKFSQLLRR